MTRFSVHYFLLFTVMATAGPYFQLILRARGFSVVELGHLQGLRALAGMCGPLLVGYLADRFGARRGLLAGCLVVFGLLLIPLNVTSSFWIAAALVAGIGCTVRTPIPLTDALAAGELEDPVHQYGRVRVWGSVGFAAALLIIRVLGLVDERSSTSMITAILIAVGLCLVSSAFLRERHGARRRRVATAGAGGGFDAVFWLFVVAAALHQVGMTAHYSFFTIYLQDVLGMESAAWVWSIGAVAEIPMLFYAGRFIGRFGLLAMMGASMAAVSLRLGVYAFVPALWVILPIQLLHAMTFGLFHAASIEFIRRKVPRERFGLAMALYLSLASALPSWIGSSLGGHVIEHWGYPTLYLTYAAAPLVGIALLAIGGERLNVSTSGATGVSHDEGSTDER